MTTRWLRIKDLLVAAWNAAGALGIGWLAALAA